jgi:putative ABC transport system permease protein
MLFWTIVKVGLKSLWANKLRSFLAMLGIIIGVGAVVSMLSLVAGASSQVLNRISAMGTNLLVVRPGQSGSRGVISGSVQTLTLADSESIVKEVAGIHSVAPSVSRAAQVKYFNRNTRITVLGTAVTYLAIRDFQVEQGRSFTEAECDRMARVAVLGPVTAENLFAGAEALGQSIKINGINFHVVGVLKAKGDQGFFNPDDQVMVPHSTSMKQIFGVDYLGEIDIQAADGADLDTVAADITTLLRKRHRLQAEDADDFRIQNQADILRMASEITATFTLLLGGIAGISLLVGGIGIMNIMLVTVTERTREIGIRKAIGAKERSILLQFLLEAVVICGLGGVIGVVLGVVGAEIIRRTTTIQAVVTSNSVLLAISFAALVGIFFGWYPARRAARLDPVEALRYE